jgi:hypothetical protein
MIENGHKLVNILEELVKVFERLRKAARCGLVYLCANSEPEVAAVSRSTRTRERSPIQCLVIIRGPDGSSFAMRPCGQTERSQYS